MIKIENLGEDVVTLTIQTASEDGRERHENGVFVLPPGKSKKVILDEETSMRIDTVQPELVDVAQAPQAPQEDLQ